MHGTLEDWCPKNAGGEYEGKMTLKSALANSVNTISVQLIRDVGPKNVIQMAHNLGIQNEIPEVPSIALGTPELSLYEMVNSYSTLANMGQYIKPTIIDRIEDKNGTILYQSVPETKDVLSEESAYVTVKVMEGVTRFGSGARLRTRKNTWSEAYKKGVITGHPYEFKNDIAGKTGTTQNNSDGWFMGMVPNLVTGVWVGADDRSVHFNSTTYGQGAAMALPIWAQYMKSCYNEKELNISQEPFKEPENLSIEVDCEKWAKTKEENSDDEPDF
jgi:penicillin-binding protein 1A